ncbi:MAG: YbaL family putative K(+) efflux transporter [Dehalococcoidia bacterium]
MPHNTALIATISIALVFAFVGGFLATRLRLPAIVGYLLAGVAVGPFTPGFIADTTLAPQLAELGVVLLMFGVGMHFSVRDLLAVRNIAIPGAIVQSAVATILAIALASAWGWGFGSGLVLGLAISVASTVVLLRSLMDRNLLDTTPGRIAVGWLIVEDLFTILVLVLLPAFAGQLGGTVTDTAANPMLEIGLALGKVVLLVALVLVVGSRGVPWLLGQVARSGSKELFTLAVLAIALGIAFGSAEIFGVSLALGAFLAGLAVGESDLSHQAALDALPLRDAFAVLFFVSVGMLFDPAVIVSHFWNVIMVLAIVLVGKPLAAFVLVVLLRHSARTGLVVAAALAQIGEFSFIVAELGRSLGLLPEEGHTLILAGALLSITINPLAFHTIGPLTRLLQRIGLRVADEPASPTAPAAPVSPAGHAIVCGYGRVGRVVGAAFAEARTPYLVVDEDRARVDDARQHGITAILGDISDSSLVERLELDQARVLVLAIPDPLAMRHLIDVARRDHPDLPIVARAHGDADRDYLKGAGVTDVVLGEEELARAMSRLALAGAGVATPTVDLH